MTSGDVNVSMKMVYWKSDHFWLGKLLDHPEIMTQGETLEELEEIIAPGLTTLNHNETFIGAEVELSVEVMEEVIAPKLSANHNVTLAYDAAL